MTTLVLEDLFGDVSHGVRHRILGKPKL